MLELIAKYRDSIGAPRPGFATKMVKWKIELDSNGDYLGVQELGDPASKNNQGRTFELCPEFPANEMNSGGKAHPLVETLNVVTLLAKNASLQATPKDAIKRDYYIALLNELAETVPEAAIAAKSLQIEGTLEKIRFDLYQKKAKPTDKVAINVGAFELVSHDLIRDWWDLRRRADKPASESSSLCLVTGEPTAPLMSHPKIAGLGTVGGLAIGSSLISFDKGAFTSFGLDQSANATVSEEAAVRYRDGLNHLISSGKKLGPMIVGHWFSGTVVPEDDPFSYLDEGSFDERPAARLWAKKLLDSFETGMRPPMAAYRYYILTLSGAAGRVMLRDWQEGSFVDLVRSMDLWFNHLSIVSSDGLGEIRDPKFLAVAASTVRTLDDLTAPAEAALWRSAVSGSNIPESAVRGALNRIRIDVLENQQRPIRMGLLKAYILRNTNQRFPMESKLNKQNDDPAYLAGRLMAALASIQLAALGNVNANVVQRYYPAASSTPALVFGRLTRQAQFHLAKMDPGLARHLDLKMAEIWGRLDGNLPKTFNLEQQTLFALGYYQQIAQDFHDRNEASAKRAAKAANSSDDSQEA